jgi:ABC-type transporter MlaC component
MREPRNVRAPLRRLAAALFALAGAAPAIAQTDPAVSEFVTYWEAAALSVYPLPDRTAAKLARACRELTGWGFDLETVSKNALKNRWQDLNPRQRITLVANVGERAVADCKDHILDYDGKPFAILGVRAAEGGEQLATASVGTARGKARNITWRLHNSDATHFRAVDVIVDGRSMVSDLYAEYERALRMQNGKVDAAIEELKPKGVKSSGR